MKNIRILTRAQHTDRATMKYKRPKDTRPKCIKCQRETLCLERKHSFTLYIQLTLFFGSFFSFFIFLKKQNPTSRSSLWENAFSYSAAERRARTHHERRRRQQTTYDFFSLIYLNKRPNWTACMERNIHRKKVHSIGSRGGREGWGLCVRLMWSTMNTFISDRPFSSSSTSAVWCVLMMMRKLIGIKNSCTLFSFVSIFLCCKATHVARLFAFFIIVSDFRISWSLPCWTMALSRYVAVDSGTKKRLNDFMSRK